MEGRSGATIRISQDPAPASGPAKDHTRSCGRASHFPFIPASSRAPRLPPQWTLPESGLPLVLPASSPFLSVHLHPPHPAPLRVVRGAAGRVRLIGGLEEKRLAKRALQPHLRSPSLLSFQPRGDTLASRRNLRLSRNPPSLLTVAGEGEAVVVVVVVSVTWRCRCVAVLSNFGFVLWGESVFVVR